MDDDSTGPAPSEQALAFGPIPSRRLGLSLGVNVVPRKTCSFNCIYCQLGRTTGLTIERREYTPTEDIVQAVLAKIEGASSVDFVTFLGDGEPLLASNIPQVLAGIREHWHGKTALITNGSLLWISEAREAASAFDVVMPTVSACDPGMYRRLHRPHRSLPFERCMDGLVRFAADYSGQIWPEVMLVEGVNDAPESLERIGKITESLRPAEVHITAPIRPPSVTSVRPPSKETLRLALQLIPKSVDFTHPESAEMPTPSSDPSQHLVDISGTHPLREEQAISILVGAGMTEQDASRGLDALVRSSSLVVLSRNGVRFYVRGSAPALRPQHV